MKPKKSLNFRLSALIGVLGLLIGIIVLTTIISERMQAKDTTIINVAGRQRMLTQRITKATLGHATETKEAREAGIVADIVVKTRAHLAKSIARAKAAGDFKLTKSMLNFTPASAARQITEAFSKDKQLTLRQASKKFRNPDNKPDAYETKVLTLMESDPQAWRNKVWKEKIIDGDRAIIRFMRPLFVSKPCLGCHGSADAVPNLVKQEFPGDLATGYKVGDVRGAISISWPTITKSIGNFQKESTKARELFNTSLNALMNGGTATLGNKDVMLDACQNSEVLQQLNLVKSIWDKMSVAIDTVFDETVDEATSNASLSYILENNVDLLAKMNEAVTLFQKASDSTAALSMNILYASVFVAVMVLGFVLLFVRKKISKPIIQIVTSLTNSSNQVASSANQISSASTALADGASTQAAGLQESSASLEEISGMTKQNADYAQQANTLSGEAKRAADSSSEAMNRMNTAIQDIQKSSQDTANIIKDIDEIAFQTNLLALNAAVEAARAGEAGKGFAVVAEEVGNLATRSAEAARNTTNMIKASLENSQTGVEITSQVDKVLDDIISRIGDTTDLVSKIATASREQAQGIDQVNSAVSQIDQVTQQNASSAEESAGASEEMSSQAELMNKAVQDLVVLVKGTTGEAKGS